MFTRKSLFKLPSLLLTALLSAALLSIPTPSPVFGSHGPVNGDKSLLHTDITCGGATTVTLEISTEPGIAGNPTDIMLVLDRSGSIGGTPLADLKTAANAFVDIIDMATDGAENDIIANGSRMGVVSFADSASLNVPLTTDAGDVGDAIDALSAGGLTNHEDAISTAQVELAGSNPGSTKIMVIFTDGQTTAGGNPDDDAASARAAGTVIYAIGLGSVNVSQLNDWATDPDSDHVFIAPSPGDLEDIFEAIGAAIVVPGATDIEVIDTVDSHFSVSDAVASKGVVNVVGNVLTWTVSELAVTSAESATLTYNATHDNTQSGGVEQVNDSVSYSDAEGHVVSFPNPAVNVRGCAAMLELTPEDATNQVGDTHNLVATVLDDFGDPVSGILVDFSVVGGPSVVTGDPSAPSPDMGSDTTDAAGEAHFNYTNSAASPDTITATAGLQTNVSSDLSDMATKTWLAISAMIDIKPGSDPNSYGSRSQGVIPVALLGSAGFDVSQVDDTSVLFGDAPSPVGDAFDTDGIGQPEDVNDDAFGDKVYHFEFQETNLDPTDTEGCMGGKINGLDFLGCDAVNIK